MALSIVNVPLVSDAHGTGWEVKGLLLMDVFTPEDDELVVSLRRVDGARGVDQHQVVAAGTPEALHEELRPAERPDRL